MNKNNDKKLFECESIIDLEEFQKMFVNFPSNFWATIINNAIFILLIALILGLIEKASLIETAIIFFVLEIINITAIILNIKNIAKKYYKKQMKDVIVKKKITTKFYNNYLIAIGDRSTIKINYSEIKKIKETNDNLYILEQTIIILQKDKCTKELIEFIRNINKDKFIVKKSKDKTISINKKEKSKLINTISMLLFIITILSIYLGLIFWSIATEISNTNIAFSNIWVMIFALPIPIASIIFGIIYKRKGYKCEKNIIIGIIMSVILVLISSTTLIENQFNTNYDEVNKYADIIDVKIPEKGKYKRVEWDSSYLKNLISNYIQFTNTKEANKFYKDIKNNPNWISEKDLSTELSNIAPSLICVSPKDDCYYLFYNIDDYTYNKTPVATGNYHYYAMIYDPSNLSLQVEDFEYEYKK